MHKSLFFGSLIILLFLGCKHHCVNDETTETTSYIPTDYSLSTNWYQNGKDINENLIDVFYILPTCVISSIDTNTNKESFTADLNNYEQRTNMNRSYELANYIFADSANFFAPYYQQITLNGYFSSEYDSARNTAMSEIKRSFQYYLDHFNQGRKFILAGFSQGGQGVVELLHYMSDETFRNMLAAYVIGFKVTKEDTISSDHFKAAQNETDLGVVITYNTSSSPETIMPLVHTGNLFCINPVSWSTSEEPAYLNDSVTITLDNTNHLLILHGLDAQAFSPQDLSQYFPLGSYHLGELTLYQEQLKENIKKRGYPKQ